MRDTVRIGRDIVPVVAPESRSWPYDAFRVVLSEDGFLLTPGEASIEFSNGSPITTSIPLKPGLEWKAGGVTARYDEFTWASFK